MGVRQEIERRIGEKEEEFQSTKKNFTKAVDGMQGALEQESKGKAEAIRMKKKLESDVVELETSLEHANAANVETQKSIKGLGGRYARFKLHMKMNNGQRRLLEITLLLQKGKPTLYRMLLKRHVPFLSNPTGQDAGRTRTF